MVSRMIGAHCAVLAGALVFCSTLQAADTLESVEKRLIEAAEKNNSMTAKLVSTMEIEQPSMKMKSKAEGSIETARRGEKTYSRTEMTSRGTNKFGDQPEQKTEEKMLSILDGEYMYVLSESNGEKRAMKMKIDPTQQKAVTKDMFETLRKDHELKLLPDEKVDGKDTYVIQATPRKPEEGTTQKSTFWFEKGSAVMVKFVTEGKMGEGKTTSTSILSDLKLGVDLKPERFVWKAPAGVEVVDMTRLAAGNEATHAEGSTAGGGSETSTASTAQKEPEEKKAAEKKPEEKKAEPKEEKKKSLVPKIKLR